MSQLFPIDMFNLASMTESMNLLPLRYGRLQQMNLFPEKGITTRQVVIEEKNGVLYILKSKPLGSPGDHKKGSKRKVRSFVVPHLPLEDVIHPSDAQGVRQFGTGDASVALAAIMNDKLQEHKDIHAVTLEHLRIGALQGIIYDGDGEILYNLFEEFKITPKVIEFDFTGDGKDVAKNCKNVTRHVEDNLLGDSFDYVHCLCGSKYFDDFVTSPGVEKAYAGYEAAAQRIGEDTRKGFKFQGIVYEEYRAKAPLEDGTLKQFIANDEAHFFPMGTTNTFATYFAPADFNETTNTIGKPFYAKQAPKKFDRGTDVHSQSNPLPLCKRPGVLVKGTMKAAA